MKTAEPADDDDSSHIEHPLYEEALEEEDVKPEAAIEKFKQIIDERQPTTALHCSNAPTPLHLPGVLTAWSRCVSCATMFAADPSGKLVKIKEDSIMHLAALYSKQGYHSQYTRPLLLHGYHAHLSLTPLV